MTHLEQQIFNALLNVDGVHRLSLKNCEVHARIAAKIALELAEKAYNVGLEQMGPLYWKGLPDVTFKQFIQDYIGD